MKVNQAQKFPSSNAGVAACMIVPEVLEEDNYERWCIFMEHHLVAQDLWDVIQSIENPKAEDSRDWIKKNALALHAIKISCGVKSFDRIKKKNLARDAWNALANFRKQPNEDANRGSEKDTEVTETWTRILENDKRSEIVSSLRNGDWGALKTSDRITEIIFPGRFTVLHIATILGHLKIVNELVKITGEDYLEMQDDNGDTALSLAAFNGEVEIAECLVRKHDKLLTIQNKKGYIPLVVACINKQKDMTSYLYSTTDFEFLLSENNKQGALFLKYCALNFMLDVGLDLYLRCPPLAASRDSITILELSAQPSRFHSRTPLSAVGRFLYQHLHAVELPSPSDGAVSTSRLEIFKRQEEQMRRIYNLKLTHTYANLVLRHWCKEISTYRDATQLAESGAISAISQAIKDGTSEIVIEILKANPDLIWCNEKLSRDILIFAINYRREDILKFVCTLDVGKKTFLSLRDKDENNVLHLAAKLQDGNLTDEEYFFDAAWMLNDEEKFFKGIKSCLPSWCHEAENRYGETPEQVFQKEHAKLAKEMEEWAKKTAESYALASVLIVTIMFAALFTVPGGNNDTGVPILSHRKLFLMFLICDTVSFLTASISLLGFLTVLTTYQSRGPFFRVLISHMVIPIRLLILSVVTMILAFTFALMLTLESKWQAPLGLIIAELTVVVVLYLLAWQRNINFLAIFS